MENDRYWQKNAEFYADFKFVDASNKVKSKKPWKNSQNENTQNSYSFLAQAFVRDICLSRHQRLRNQHKIFLISMLIFSRKKIFWVIISLFAYFKCKCDKTVHFQTFCKKQKVIFFQYLSFSVWFPLSLKHWSLLLHNNNI